jgi:ketosteroid isomerase-like protein
MSSLTTDEVEAAADRLVAAFAATDTEAYFACFAESATFVFHPEPHRLDDRAAYEALWAEWVASGWRVEECESTDRLVQVQGDTAVLSHSVRTITSSAGERTTTLERESIVFVRDGDDVVAVHEHLSPAPPAS